MRAWRPHSLAISDAASCYMWKIVRIRESDNLTTCSRAVSHSITVVISVMKQLQCEGRLDILCLPSVGHVYIRHSRKLYWPNRLLLCFSLTKMVSDWAYRRLPDIFARSSSYAPARYPIKMAITTSQRRLCAEERDIFAFNFAWAGNKLS